MTFRAELGKKTVTWTHMELLAPMRQMIKKMYFLFVIPQNDMISYTQGVISNKSEVK